MKLFILILGNDDLNTVEAFIKETGIDVNAEILVSVITMDHKHTIAKCYFISSYVCT